MRDIFRILELVVFIVMTVSWGIGGMLVWRIFRQMYRMGWENFLRPWFLLPADAKRNLKMLWICLLIIVIGALLIFLCEHVIGYH
ncbi:MAG: hypothetical protein AB1756_03485 [Acidobacteriota bacterium]